MITWESKGDFRKTGNWLNKLSKINVMAILNKYGSDGVEALRAATPKESSQAANSWTYDVGKSGSGYFIKWSNTNIEGGFPVAIMLQYGYGTGTGGYVQGRDYINPAMRPIFDKIAKEAWKAVKSA